MRAGGGEPDVVTVKEPALPVLKVVVGALMIAGTALTTKVKFWVMNPAALVAVTENG